MSADEERILVLTRKIAEYRTIFEQEEERARQCNEAPKYEVTTAARIKMDALKQERKHLRAAKLEKEERKRLRAAAQQPVAAAPAPATKRLRDTTPEEDDVPAAKRAKEQPAAPVRSAPLLHGYVSTQMKPMPAQELLTSETSEPMISTADTVYHRLRVAMNG